MTDVNRSALARLMLEWEEARLGLDVIEAAIKTVVLELGRTQATGNVKATFSKGRKTYKYREVGEDASEKMIAVFTETIPATTKTDWRSLVLRGMKVEQEKIPFTQSKPRVTIKLT